jgi:homogentisate 1,2-dioxygenase
MSGHGPDSNTFERASTVELKPQKLENTLAFMFETSMVIHPTQFAMDTKLRQHEYYRCWQGLKNNFRSTR